VPYCVKNKTFSLTLLNTKSYRKISSFFLKVEQQGIEPWSKHGIHMLSTCLVAYWFSTMVRKETPKPSL